MKFEDTKLGALKVVNHDYGLSWELADVRGMPARQVVGVWLLVHMPSKVALAVNTKLGMVTDDYDFDEAVTKYEAQLSRANRMPGKKGEPWRRARGRADTLAPRVARPEPAGEKLCCNRKSRNSWKGHCEVEEGLEP